jgi:hypothetical protein
MLGKDLADNFTLNGLDANIVKIENFVVQSSFGVSSSGDLRLRSVSLKNVSFLFRLFSFVCVYVCQSR